MSFEKGPKTGALVPENDSTLSPLLEKLGVLVKRYRDLDDFDSIRKTVQDLPRELIFLFCNILTSTSDGEDPQQMNIFEYNINEQPNDDPNDFHPSEGLVTPEQEIGLAMSIKERLQSSMTDGVRKKVEVALKLPRESDLLKTIPKEARFLADDFSENELVFLLKQWWEQSIGAADAANPKSPGLDPKDLGILIVHSDSKTRQSLKDRLLSLLDIPSENILEADDDLTALGKLTGPLGPKVKVLLAGGKTSDLDSLELFKIVEENRSDICRILLMTGISEWKDSDVAQHTIVSPPTVHKLHAILLKCLPALNLKNNIFKEFPDETQLILEEVAMPVPSALPIASLPTPATSLASEPLPVPSPTLAPVPPPPDRVALPILAPRILIVDGASYHGHLEMSGSVDSLDSGGFAIDPVLSETGRLLESTAKDSSDLISRILNEEPMTKLQAIQALVDAETQILTPESESPVAMGQLETESGQIQFQRRQRMDMRKKDLEVEDHRQTIHHLLNKILANKQTLNLNTSCTQYDSRALKLFHGNPCKSELVASEDWEIGRSLSKCAEMLGFSSLVDLEGIAHGASRGYASSQKIRNFKMNTLTIGVGNGVSMDEFSKIHALSPLKNHINDIGFSRSLLYRFSDLLTRIIQKPSKGEAAQLTEDQLKRFASHINTLLLKYNGRDGRYVIDSAVPEDQDRLREHLLKLATHKEKEIKSIASGKQRSLQGSTGRYAMDTKIALSDEDIQSFKEFVGGPEAFFNRYFPQLLKASSSQEWESLFGQTKRDMIMGDFRNLGKILKNTGQFLTFAYSVKSFSHLEDGDYGEAVNEICRHLVPGGIFVDDGVVESYTWSHRIDDLRQVQKNLGSEYSIQLVGDSNYPHSVIIQRGVPNGKNAKSYDFSKKEVEKKVRDGFQLVPLDNYEITWPSTGYRNKVVSNVKTKYVRALHQGMKDDELKIHGTQTWRNAGYDHIDQEISKRLESFMRSKIWRELSGKFLNRAKKGAKSDLFKDSDIEEFWNHSLSQDELDQFIRKTLLEHHGNDRYKEKK